MSSKRKEKVLSLIGKKPSVFSAFCSALPGGFYGRKKCLHFLGKTSLNDHEFPEKDSDLCWLCVLCHGANRQWGCKRIHGDLKERQGPFIGYPSHPEKSPSKKFHSPCSGLIIELTFRSNIRCVNSPHKFPLGCSALCRISSKAKKNGIFVSLIFEGASEIWRTPSFMVNGTLCAADYLVQTIKCHFSSRLLKHGAQVNTEQPTTGSFICLFTSIEVSSTSSPV